jgi:hypothetical protein
MHMLYTCKKHKNIWRKYKNHKWCIKVRNFDFFYFFIREWLDILPEQQKAPPDTLALLMGRDYILITIALLTALGGAGGPKFKKVVCLSLVSGMFLSGAPIALGFSPIRNDLPYIELSIDFGFKISRAVRHRFSKRSIIVVQSIAGNANNEGNKLRT